MLVRAIALPYKNYSGLDIQQLVHGQPELLQSACFVSILVSMSENRPEEWVLPRDNPRCLTMFYDDIRSDSHRHFPPEAIRNSRQMSDAVALEIVKFLRRSNERPEPEVLYVNCSAGISRSGAVVALSRELFGMCPAQFQTDNPRINPNDVQLPMLRHAACLK